MRDQKYIQRLTRDLPQWVERGWVQRGAEQNILAYVESQHSSNERMIIALTLMGVLLLGSGVITFFAAHWAGYEQAGQAAGAVWRHEHGLHCRRNCCHTAATCRA